MSLTSGTPVAVFDDVSKAFGDVVALSEVSCTITPGITAILGPNGAGKSTLLRLLCGLTSPDQGTVRLLDSDPRTDIGLYRRLGLVPQQEAVLERLTAREFVASAAGLHGVTDADAAAEGALGRVDLDPADRRPVATYSKGMRQRVKVAQALVHDPDVLVLDEPLNGMDPRQRMRTIALFRELAGDGRCVIVSSHVLAEVERFGSRILLLAQGRLAAEGDFHEVRNLMDDRPRRIRVRTDRARELGAALLAAGAADGVDLSLAGGRQPGTSTDDRAAQDLTVDTRDVAAFRTLIAREARRAGARLHEVVPLDDDLESVFRYLIGRPS